MKVSVLGNFAYPNSLELYYFEALAELGMNVVTRPDEEADITIVVKWLKNPEDLNGTKVLIFPDLTKRYEQYFNHVKEYFDYIFICHKEPIIDNKKIFHIGFAYSPRHHYPIESNKYLDVLFIGTRHPSREWIEWIPNITIVGDKWKNSKAVYGIHLIDLYAQAKIVLNDFYPNDTENMRQYEALAMNSFLLTPNPYPFEDGKHLVVYHDYQDLLDKIKYYLKHEEERQEIANNGYERVMDESYSNRVKQIFEIMGVKICQEH